MYSEFDVDECEWLALSSDLNSTQHLWDEVGL